MKLNKIKTTLLIAVLILSTITIAIPVSASTVEYNVSITDNDTDFGNQSNEVVGIPITSVLTLNQLFAGEGLKYTYTVLEGGTYNGASPIIAVIDLADGRHVVLFPGWGARTGDESLQFGDTVATSTADTGTVPVDFVVYDSTFHKTWGSPGSYPAYTAIKASSGCPIVGTEVVTRIAIQHQGANTGEKDKLVSLTFYGLEVTDPMTFPVEDTTVPVGDMGTVTVDGKGTITTYECAEPGTGFSSSIGEYFDVKVPDVTNVNFLDIIYIYEDADVPAGMDEKNLRIWWFDDPDWIVCSDQTINTVANKITVHISATTSPNLSDMTGTPFGLGSTVNLSPIEGPVETEVEVSGNDATPFGLVEAYWKNLGGAKLDEGYADNAGDYSMDITIPEDIAGPHWVVVKDVSTGDTIGAEFTIEPEIVLKPTSGLPDDEVTVTGTGFAAEEEITIYFDDDVLLLDPAPETSLLGSFEATIVVPEVGYAIYDVTAKDETDNTATTPFEVTATIKLEPDEGPSGTIVTITGEGFTETEGLAIDITFGVEPVVQIADIETNADGTFTGQFIVPTVDIAVYDISADDGTITATTSFNVTETTTVTLTPTAGSPDSEVTIEGEYFTAVADTEVTVKFEGVLVETLHTTATGGFKGTFDVPYLPTKEYTVTVEDENGLIAKEYFTIAITLIAIDPTEAPTGTEVTIIGYGFTDGEKANVTFGTTLVLEDIPVNELKAGTTFIVPTIPIGTYTITAEDSASLTYSVSFDVNATTELILTPPSAPVDYTVSIVGNYFSGLSPIEVVLYNETATYWSETCTTLANGTFTTTFKVPELDLGDYFINATDPTTFPPEDENLINVLEFPFSVIKPYLEIHTVSTNYDPSDTVRFYVNSTFILDLEIDIEDPVGYPFMSIYCPTIAWFKVDDYYVIPYAASFDLPSDAITGAWNWTAFDASEMVANGTFTVGVIPPEMGTLSIVTAPAGGEVFVDGVSWGIAPQSQEVEVGTYTVTFGDMTGYTTPSAEEAVVTADTTTDILGNYVEAVPPELPAETSNEETLDSTGAPKTSFALGETVQAYSDITNVGTETQTMLIVVQFKDPDYRVFAPVFLTVTLGPGQSFGYAPGLIIPLAGYTTGTWTAKIMVFDAWPALGGVPIGLPVTLSFTVTS